MKQKEQQLRKKIPKVDYSTIETIIKLRSNGYAISTISEHTGIPAEIVNKIISDYYQRMDLKTELLASIDSYNAQYHELQILLAEMRRKNQDDDEIKNLNEMIRIYPVLQTITERKIKAFKNFEKTQKTSPIPKLVPTEKQKEIIDILMKLGSADKKTIAKNMDPQVSETRVYHLLHGRNGKQGLINRYPGLSCKKQGNKNIYQLEYIAV